MEFIQNLVEYYDELYATTEKQEQFFKTISQTYSAPLKMLQIGSGSGSFAIEAAKQGFDVTGIEMSQALLDSASLKRRNQLLSLRFFKLSTVEMTKFLGKSFYNILICLNNRLCFLREKSLMPQFFADAKSLLSENGTLVLQLLNYEFFKASGSQPAPRKSIRASLLSKLTFAENEKTLLSQQIETGNGKILPIVENEQIYPLTKEELCEFAKEAGFSTIKLYSDFSGTELTPDSEEIIAVIS